MRYTITVPDDTPTIRLLSVVIPHDDPVHNLLLDKARLLPAVEWDINELHILVRERTQAVGNTTSQMRLWGTIDLRSLSLTQEKEPIALLGSDGLSQMLGTESGPTRESESSIRLPYVFSPSDQKWALYSTQPPVDEASLPQGLSIASYNVLAEFHHPPSHDRYPIIIRNLLEQLAAAEVLVLEEVTDDFLSYFMTNCMNLKIYHLSYRSMLCFRL